MNLLRSLELYDDQLQKASANFKITYDHAHELAIHYVARAWKPEDGLLKN